MKSGLRVSKVERTLGGIVATEEGMLIEGGGRSGDVIVSQFNGSRFSTVGIVAREEAFETERHVEPTRLEDRRKKRRRIVTAEEIAFERKPFSLAFSSMTYELIDVLAGVVCTSSFHRQPGYGQYDLPAILSPAPGYDRFGVIAEIEISDPVGTYANPGFCSTVMYDSRVRYSAVWRIAGRTFLHHFGSLTHEGLSLFDIYGVTGIGSIPGWSGWVLTGPKWTWSIVTAMIKAVWDLAIGKWNGGVYDGQSRELSLQGRIQLLGDALGKGEADDMLFEIPKELYPELGDGVDVWITRWLYDPYYTPDFVGRLKPGGRGAEIDGWEVSYDQSNTAWQYMQKGLGALRLTKTMPKGRYYMVIRADFHRNDLDYINGETIVRIRYGQWISP